MGSYRAPNTPAHWCPVALTRAVLAGPQGATPRDLEMEPGNPIIDKVVHMEKLSMGHGSGLTYSGRNTPNKL